MNYKSYHKVEHRLQWWLEEINWGDSKNNYTGKNVTVAILDTGIDNTHPDFSNMSIIDEIKINTLNSNKNDDRSHGTAIAGIIGAYPSSEKGVLGLSPDVNILSIDITDEETVDTEDLVSGIKIAIENNVDIISISVGVKKDNTQLHNVILEAYNKGIIVVAAAGNYMNNDILYPAKYSEVLCVGALDKKGEVISPKGTVEHPVVYLPGVNIVTTSCNSSGYLGANGTSFSTSILSGIIALMKEANPNATLKDIYFYFNNIQASSEKIDVTQCISYIKGV